MADQEPGFETHFQREVFEQPDVMRRLLKEGRPGIERIAGIIRERRPGYIVFSARGTSDNAARYGQYLFGTTNGLTVALATPSLFTLYDSPPAMENALVLGISQSGQSPDVVTVLEEGRRQGALTVAITNTPGSPIDRAAGHSICMLAEKEHCPAASKTYSASLMVLAMLSTALAEDAARFEALEALPGMLEAVLETAPQAIGAAERYRYMQSCVVTGRGHNYSTAFEVALKLKEMTYVMAEPFSPADFLHGPIALVDHGFPVIAVVPGGRLAATMCMVDFLGKAKERGAELVVISGQEDALAMAKTPIRIPVDVPEWLSPLVNIVPGQLFALGLALAKGFNPDRPRYLSKVTLTR